MLDRSLCALDNKLSKAHNLLFKLYNLLSKAYNYLYSLYNCLPPVRRRVVQAEVNLHLSRKRRRRIQGRVRNRICTKKDGILSDPVFFKCRSTTYLQASSTATATATVAPTIGLLPMPRKPIISTCAGTEDDPANCASECMRPMVSVMP